MKVFFPTWSFGMHSDNIFSNFTYILLNINGRTRTTKTLVLLTSEEISECRSFCREMTKSGFLTIISFQPIPNPTKTSVMWILTNNRRKRSLWWWDSNCPVSAYTSAICVQCNRDICLCATTSYIGQLFLSSSVRVVSDSCLFDSSKLAAIGINRVLI